ncbi:hypothetical protein ACIBWG_01270 [Streptomyces griseoaurantiacus]|uniref:Uncharacterized protein n=1 Tax=Streptomyces griseoaurantiacus TaxID=68213 RepID=A0ABZ1V5K9_9ACTN|nr:hypothetical protein [Streptomyces jietaisiensis]
MQWSTLLAVVVGAVVGGLSSAWADHARWRREVTERDRETLRATYVAFLEAAAQTTSAISDTAHDPSNSLTDRAAAARQAVNRLGLYERSFQVDLTAPQRVGRAAGDVVDAILTLRDVVVRGSTPGSGEYEEAWQSIHRSRNDVREVMRGTILRA